MFIHLTFLSIYSVLGIVLNLGNAEMNKDIQCNFFPQVVQTPMWETEKQFTITMLHGKTIKGERKEYYMVKKRDT